MIITDNFIFINFPKTGSTFAREVLSKIYYPPLENKWKIEHFIRKVGKSIKLARKESEFQIAHFPELRDISSKRYLNLTPHGLRSQIPEEHKNKPIISIKRNPFEQIVSHYEFADWKKTSVDWENGLKEILPSYPEIKFESFVKNFIYIAGLNKHPKIKDLNGLSTLSLNLILFFSKDDPFEIINNWHQDFYREKFHQDFQDIVFLENKQLNEELYDLLLKFNYSKNKINFILGKDKSNVSKPIQKSYKQYFSKELTKYVLASEKLVFDLFPEYRNWEK